MHMLIGVKMAKIKINGKYLHKVQMALKSNNEWCTSYLSYPEHRIEAKIQKGILILKIPPLLVIEMFRSGIFPKNKNELMQVKIRNKDLGAFRVSNFKYPDELNGDGLVDIKLIGAKRIKRKNE